MADRWQTYPVEFRGGLVTNLSPLQQGANAPGSARILRNFEPSVEGGYRRIEGYDKYDSNLIPPYGSPVVHGSGQSGTTLISGNIDTTPEAGDTLTVAGVSGTYTIASSGVTFDGTNNRATLTLTTSLASSPANAAEVTFTSTTSNYLALGVASWEDTALVAKNDNIFSTSGTGYTHINVPNYGTPLVNGGSQTSTSLDIDGLTSAPQAGDVFKIAGVNLVYTVTADAPALYDGSTFTVLNSAPADVVSATHVTEFKKALFFGRGTILTFTEPYTDDSFSVANGSGNINVGGVITGLVVFRQQLIVFTERNIQQLQGNTVADFTLQPITKDIGCIEGDTIQEIGGDIIFLGPDGLRLLSATERIGDFGLAAVSKQIQKNITDFIAANTAYTSTVIREKSQYRLLGYNNNDTTEVVLFANNDGYLYQMESGNSFDGSTIKTTFATPHLPIQDPRIRKTFYKLFLYTDPQGSVNFDVSLKLDFNGQDVIQPQPISFANTAGVVGFYGTGTYGTTSYGTKLQKLFEAQVIGSGFAVSFQFTSDNSDPPFSLDALTVEYGINDRR